ncbi:flavodoxin domain-containing protein, partial [Bacillus velezensis]|uniref:flavodoxin domain-containing protein n=1 Tax=Bacillus velezensis TaxID=492670 RepID=UPI0021B5D8A8
MDIGEDMEKVEFRGKRFALFGCGDRWYEFFWGGVEELEKVMKRRGGGVVVRWVKIEKKGEGSEEEEVGELGREFGGVWSE